MAVRRETPSRFDRRAQLVGACVAWAFAATACNKESLPEGECQRAHIYDVDENCYVCVPTGADEQFSLVRALTAYNDTTQQRAFCAAAIRVWDDVATVALERPVELGGYNDLVLEPHPVAGLDRLVTLDAHDATALESDAQLEADGESISCAVVVRAAGVTLRRLHVSGYRHGAGICIAGDDVVLEDVAVTDNQGDGVVFLGGARRGQVRGYFVATGNGGYGLRIAAEAGSGNSLDATPGLVLAANEAGVVVDSDEELRIVVDPPAAAVDAGGAPLAERFSVTGRLLRCAPSEPLEACTPRGAEAVQLHRLDPGAEAFLSQDYTTFLRYLDPSEFQSDGTFSFVLDRAGDGAAFFLVAESEEDEPASASPPFTLE